MGKRKLTTYLMMTVLLVLTMAIWGRAAITQIAGLAIAESNTKWNNVRDASAGDNLTNGILATLPFLYDGTNFDRVRGDTTYGMDVDVTRLTGNVTVVQPTAASLNATVTGTVTTVPTYAGSQFYAIKRDNITTASVNLAFGFTTKKVAIETDASNTAEVCIDWLGGTAVCPAANTAGDDRLGAGRTLILDDFAATSISIIAASGTQVVTVRAW